MTIGSTSSLADVAFAVCTALDRAGATAVLTGGGAATYHAPAAYQSADLDFVLAWYTGDGAERALTELGFARRGDYYAHRDAPFPLEFPPGPLMVGDELIEVWRTERRDDELLHVVSPTDCCRDRLAALLFWNDFSGLEQALAVARACRDDVDLEVVRAWCERARAAAKYELFARRLQAAP